MGSFSGIDRQAVLAVVSTLAKGKKAVFRFGTGESPFAGGQCHVYAVQFLIEEEVSILKRLEECGFSRSPRVTDYDASFDNPIRFPYMVLTWAEGKPLEWSDSVPSRREDRNKVIRQMADSILELAACTQRPGTYTH